MRTSCGDVSYAHSTSVDVRGSARKAGCLQAEVPSGSRSAAPEFSPTSGKATEPHHAAVFAWSGCGGGPTVHRDRAPCCRSAESASMTAGARIRPTAVTTNPFMCLRAQRLTVSGATTGCTISLSSWTTTPARASPGVAARYLFTSRGRDLSRPPGAWRFSRPACNDCWSGSAHKPGSSFPSRVTGVQKLRCPREHGWRRTAPPWRNPHSCPWTTTQGRYALRSSR